MPVQPRPVEQPTYTAPIPASDGHFIDAINWVPNELAVTVRAPEQPTFQQLRVLSARLNRLLSDVDLSIVPFYIGGQLLSRAGFVKEGRQSAAEQKQVQVEVEVGSTPHKIWVEVEREEQWQIERKRCSGGFPGVYHFGMGPTRIAIVFYTVLTHRRSPDQKRDSVQIAVDQINRHLPLGGADDDLPRVLAAMPNWLSYTLPGGPQPSTGPGAPPMWSADAKLPSGAWVFKQPPFAALIQQNAENTAGRVTVIAFDTAPGDKDTIIASAQRLPDYSQNARLQQIVQDLQTGKMLVSDPYAHILLTDYFIAGQDDMGRPFGYNMADHGLFVMDIIRNIVPQAEIKLVRTQNDYGAGDLSVFLDALQQVARREDTKQLVLNLSLGVLPPLEELHRIWFGSTCCEAPTFTDALRTLEQLHLGLRLAVRTLIERGVVIVAAAGNDSVGKVQPLGPRFPARYEGVLGVAAVNSHGDAAAYSNQANVDPWGTGIATFGGEEPSDATSTAPQGVGSPDAVHSLYLNDSYPPLNLDDQVNPGDPKYINKTGWAWWSGTSFATPVASGLAANYVLAGYPGQQVIQTILSNLATAPYSDRLQAPILEVGEE